MRSQEATEKLLQKTHKMIQLRQESLKLCNELFVSLLNDALLGDNVEALIKIQHASDRNRYVTQCRAILHNLSNSKDVLATISKWVVSDKLVLKFGEERIKIYPQTLSVLRTINPPKL